MLVTARELAKILNVPESWIYDHTKNLPHFKVGHYVRFNPDEVLRYYQANQTKGDS